MWMLTPASLSEPNRRAETPGLERMPAPTRDRMPMSGLKCRLRKPSSSRAASRASRAAAESPSGQVKEMLVRPVPSAETSWTIMSMLASVPATIAKMRAAAPGTSGTPTSVILSWLRSWAIPEMTGASTWSSLAVGRGRAWARAAMALRCAVSTTEAEGPSSSPAGSEGEAEAAGAAGLAALGALGALSVSAATTSSSWAATTEGTKAPSRRPS